MKLKLSLFVCVSLLLNSCALNSDPYEDSFMVHDKVTGKSSLVRVARLCYVRPIEVVNVLTLDYPPCLVLQYSLEQGAEIVEFNLAYYYNIFSSALGTWFNMREFWVEGVRIPTSDSVRNRILGQKSEKMDAYVPLDLFKQWSCREEPLVVTTRGQYFDIEDRLKINTMQLFLAKAEELQVVDTNGGCTTRIKALP